LGQRPNDLGNCQDEGVKAEGVKAKGVKEQQSTHLPFYCQLSIVNCQLLKSTVNLLLIFVVKKGE